MGLSCHLSFRLLLYAQQILTTVPMDTPTGKTGGVSERRHGVTECMEKGALDRLDVPPHPSHTTALQGMPIGWLGGAWAKRCGVVNMRAKAAHQLLEDVPESLLSRDIPE